MPVGPLIGRESELLALEQALASARLVTVTGAGGCGKTRVALELLGRIRDRGEPIEGRVVELAIVRSTDHVVDAFLRALTPGSAPDEPRWRFWPKAWPDDAPSW
jgi:hypothetical protein